MDVKALLNKVKIPIGKYKYAILVLIIGFILMTLPNHTSANNKTTQTTSQQAAIPMNEQLAALLTKVEGAGRVEVMLSIEAGEEILYQSDEDCNTTDQTSSLRKETVIITDSERDEVGLVKQTNPPVYLGAIILCEGADSPRVQLALCDAVSKITGLGSDRISILKMK